MDGVQKLTKDWKIKKSYCNNSFKDLIDFKLVANESIAGKSTKEFVKQKKLDNVSNSAKGCKQDSILSCKSKPASTPIRRRSTRILNKSQKKYVLQQLNVSVVPTGQKENQNTDTKFDTESKENASQTKEERCYDISQWGLPQSIVHAYKSRNIHSMFRWQYDCLSLPSVLEGKNLVFSAPTSAGKTLVAEILMLKTVTESKKKSIMILPFVSVVQEKVHYFQEMFEDAGIVVDGYMGSHNPPGGFKSVDIAICTIEKANNLVNRLMEEKRLHELGILVVDELHMLGDYGRGYLLELLLTKLLYNCKKDNIDIQIVGMSATLPNLNVVSFWLNSELFCTDFRPVPLHETFKVGPILYDAQTKTPFRDMKDAEITIPDDSDHTIYLSIETVAAGHGILIFCPSKNWCENLATSIAKMIYTVGKPNTTAKDAAYKDVGEKLREHLNGTLLNDIILQLKNSPSGLDSILSLTVPFGVAYHHAGLTFDERDVIEGAFRHGILKVLVATSTLSSGVNLPARRVIIRSPLFFGSAIDVLSYKQMVGRAGRKGIDEKGESILLCKESERTIALSLVDSELRPIKSCLIKSGTGGLHSSLKRALIEVIASGVASTRQEVLRYVSCTLLYASLAKEKDSDDGVEGSIDACLDYLVQNDIIFKQEEKETKDIKYKPSRLGVAMLASGFSPDEALRVLKELQLARRCFVLENDLHILYEVTPPYLSDQMGSLDWMHFMSLWEDLPEEYKRVGELVGVQDSFIGLGVQGRISKNVARNAHKLAVHQRFYATLALNDLIQEVPLSTVAKKYNCNRGILQSLQQTTSTFAGMLTLFCNRLGWHNLELLFASFQKRVHFGVQQELCDLIQLSTLNAQRARALYNAGYESVASLASADSGELALLLCNMGSFESAKQLEGDLADEAVKRSEAKRIRITGKKGVNEKEAAALIVHEAQNFIRQELGLNTLSWKSEKKLLPSSVKSLKTADSEKDLDLSRNVSTLNRYPEILKELYTDEGKTNSAECGAKDKQLDKSSSHIQSDVSHGPLQITSQENKSKILFSNRSKQDHTDSDSDIPTDRHDPSESVCETSLKVPSLDVSFNFQNKTIIDLENDFSFSELLLSQIAAAGDLSMVESIPINPVANSISKARRLSFSSEDPANKNELKQSSPKESSICLNSIKDSSKIKSFTESEFDFIVSVDKPKYNPVENFLDEKESFGLSFCDDSLFDCMLNTFSSSNECNTTHNQSIAADNRPSSSKFRVKNNENNFSQNKKCIQDSPITAIRSVVSEEDFVLTKSFENCCLQERKEKRLSLEASKAVENKVAASVHETSADLFDSEESFTHAPESNKCNRRSNHLSPIQSQAETSADIFDECNTPTNGESDAMINHHLSSSTHKDLVTIGNNDGVFDGGGNDAFSNSILNEGLKFSGKNNLPPPNGSCIKFDELKDVDLKYQSQFWNSWKYDTSSPHTDVRNNVDKSVCISKRNTTDRECSFNSADDNLFDGFDSNDLFSPPKNGAISGKINTQDSKKCLESYRTAQHNDNSLSNNSNALSSPPKSTVSGEKFCKDVVENSKTAQFTDSLNLTLASADESLFKVLCDKTHKISINCEKKSLVSVDSNTTSNDSLNLTLGSADESLFNHIRLSSIKANTDADEKNSIKNPCDMVFTNKISVLVEEHMRSQPPDVENFELETVDVSDSELIDFLELLGSKDVVSFSLACEKEKESQKRIGPPKEKSSQSRRLKCSVDDHVIVGVAFCFGKESYYTELSNDNINDKKLGLVQQFFDTCHSMVAYDLKSQYRALWQGCGLLIREKCRDPTIAAWLLDPALGQQSLASLVNKYWDEAMVLLEEFEYSREGLGLQSWSCVPSKRRASTEAFISFHLMRKLEECLRNQNLVKTFEEVEMATVISLAKMEQNGFGFDAELSIKYRKILQEKQNELLEDAFKAARRKFNISNSRDVSRVLFKELRLNPELGPESPLVKKHLGMGTPFRGRRLPPELKTNRECLEKIMGLHQLPKMIVDWRKLSFATTKVLMPLLKRNKFDSFFNMNRLYCISYMYTLTGRINVHSPNLQFIPRDFDVHHSASDDAAQSEDNLYPCSENELLKFGVSLRNLFIPSKGNVLLAADYSQLELRILAHLSKEKKLLASLNSDDDVFKQIASNWKHVSIASVTNEQRQQAKKICYGIIYGMSPSSLAQQLNTSKEEASVFMETFLNTYPGLKTYFQSAIESCEKFGYVTTLMNRRRYLPNILSPRKGDRAQAERQAINTTIQGSAADLTKMAMVQIERDLRKAFPNSGEPYSGRNSEVHRRKQPKVFCGGFLVLHMHDELIYEVAEKDLSVVARIVRHSMEQTTKLSVKLPVKIRSGLSWGSMVELM